MVTYRRLYADHMQVTLKVQLYDQVRQDRRNESSRAGGNGILMSGF